MELTLIAGIVAAGVVVGVASALFGVGGGLLMVPFMVILLDETQHLAEGTSLVVIVPTAIAGVIAHRRSGYVSFKHGALLAAGGVGGSYLGAVLAHEIDPASLQNIFAIFLLAMGLRLALEGWKQRSSGAGASRGPDRSDPQR